VDPEAAGSADRTESPTPPAAGSSEEAARSPKPATASPGKARRRSFIITDAVVETPAAPTRVEGGQRANEEGGQRANEEGGHRANEEGGQRANEEGGQRAPSGCSFGCFEQLPGVHPDAVPPATCDFTLHSDTKCPCDLRAAGAEPTSSAGAAGAEPPRAGQSLHDFDRSDSEQVGQIHRPPSLDRLPVLSTGELLSASAGVLSASTGVLEAALSGDRKADLAIPADDVWGALGEPLGSLRLDSHEGGDDSQAGCYVDWTDEGRALLRYASLSSIDLGDLSPHEPVEKLVPTHHLLPTQGACLLQYTARATRTEAETELLAIDLLGYAHESFEKARLFRVFQPW